MKLHIEWMRPFTLKDGRRQNLIYTTDLAKLPKTAGIYVFGRRWGSGIEALYVGKAQNLRSRVKGQLNNLRLMQHLKNARSGKRVLLVGRAITKPGQRQAKVLRLAERALIRYFLSERYDLVNKQGTRLRRHELFSSGKQPKRFIPSLMYLERARRE